MKTAYRKWMAKRLEYFRELHKLEPNQVADMLGKNRPAYKAYEAGKAVPSVFSIKKLCEIYKITVDQFLEGCDKITA